MAKEQPDYESKENSSQRQCPDLAVAETLRSISACKEDAATKAEAKSEEKISVFWRVFGGTLLSIGALVVMTVYGNLSSSITELRKDINQEIEKRTEYASKADLTRGMTSQWTAIKEIQSATGALGTVNDRVKVIDQHLERTVKNIEEDRKDTRRKLDDQRKLIADDKVELARQVDERRKALESKFQEVQQKMDEQRRIYEEDRKEFVRKLEEQRKTFEEERRELLTRVQTMCERLATVEGRTAVLSNLAKGMISTPTSGN